MRTDTTSLFLLYSSDIIHSPAAVRHPARIAEGSDALTIFALPATIHTLLWTQRYHYHISRDSYTITKLTINNQRKAKCSAVNSQCPPSKLRQRLSLLQPHALATTITPSLRAKQLQYIYQACAKGLLAPSKHFAYAATAYIVQNYSFIITTSILITTYDQ